MMSRSWFPAALAALAASGALAAAPAPPTDPRVRVLDYDPGRIVRIVGALRSATQIVLAPDEVIEHVALGDGGGWEVAPEGEVLFLKPLAAAAPTNLIVTSRRGSERRHYLFDLQIRSGQAGLTFIQIRFRYPQDARVALDQALSAQAAALDQQVLQLKLDRGVLEGRRNLAYSLQGPTELAPLEVSDNGRFTLLRFAANQPLPALYAVEADGAEALTPFDVRGEFLVVHHVARELRLRRGREVVCVYNEAFDPHGSAPVSGTSSSEVRRTNRSRAER